MAEDERLTIRSYRSVDCVIPQRVGQRLLDRDPNERQMRERMASGAEPVPEPHDRVDRAHCGTADDELLDPTRHGLRPERRRHRLREIEASLGRLTLREKRRRPTRGLVGLPRQLCRVHSLHTKQLDRRSCIVS